MSTPNSRQWPQPPLIVRYVLAILSVIAAVIILRWPALHLQSALVSLFFCAVIFSSLLGGAGPGLLATVLSVLAFYYYFLPPEPSFAAKPEEIPRLVIFAVSALVVGTLCAIQRSVTESLRRARDDLKKTVKELQEANDVFQIESRERKHAENKLERSETYLAEAQKLSLTGSFGWNAPSGEMFWSEETFRIFQYSRTTKPTMELILQRVHPEDAALVKLTIECALQDGKNFEHEYRLMMPDRSVKYVDVVAHSLSDESGNIEFVGAVMDVTERKQAEESLRQAQADLARFNRVSTVGELVASIAHEVNQPLGAIVTNGHACVRLLSREAPDIDKSREVIGRMISDGMRASQVIKRIRELLHKSPPEKAPLNINEIVQEVIALVSSDLIKSKVELKAELAGDLPLVEGDRIQLQQVILNLILNAKDAMSAVQTHPRKLLITSRKSTTGQIVVAVRDSGNGLDPKDADRIFDPFFSSKPEGMGLGLSISRRIIEDHGGRLFATPNEPQGAVFQFTLPAEVESIWWK
jgi:PAS domain S-box-containing protein